MPSPQEDVQPVAVQVGSSWQVPEQPSNGTALPSSQLSAPSLTLSPQTVGTHLHGEPLHLKPCSIWQRALQPSAAVLLPSSQPSFASVVPSPQECTRSQAMPG